MEIHVQTIALSLSAIYNGNTNLLTVKRGDDIVQKVKLDSSDSWHCIVLDEVEYDINLWTDVSMDSMDEVTRLTIYSITEDGKTNTGDFARIDLTIEN